MQAPRTRTRPKRMFEIQAIFFAWRDKHEIQEKKLLICPFFLPEDKRRVLYLHVFFLIGQGSNVSSKHQTQILFSALFRKKDIPFDTQDILEKNGINSEPNANLNHKNSNKIVLEKNPIP